MPRCFKMGRITLTKVEFRVEYEIAVKTNETYQQLADRIGMSKPAVYTRINSMYRWAPLQPPYSSYAQTNRKPAVGRKPLVNVVNLKQLIAELERVSGLKVTLSHK